jgi:hypothetical protein
MALLLMLFYSLCYKIVLNMLNKLTLTFVAALALSAYSFTTIQQTTTSQKVVLSSYLQVTNPSAGVVVLDWNLENGNGRYTVSVFGSGISQAIQTSNKTATFTGLPAGTHRFVVTSGNEYIIIDELCI